MARIEVRSGTAAEAARVFDDAFYDYPVMRYVLGDAEPYADRLAVLHDLWAHEAAAHDFDILIVEVDGEVAAAATAARPDSVEESAEHAALERDTWQRLGAGAHGRYLTYSQAAHKVHSDRPGWYLDMLGVRSAFQKLGLGRVLLDEVHARSAGDPASEGVLLTTENAVNVPFYERHGYAVIAHEVVVDGLETWGFFRPDEPAT